MARQRPLPNTPAEVEAPSGWPPPNHLGARAPMAPSLWTKAAGFRGTERAPQWHRGKAAFASGRLGHARSPSTDAALTLPTNSPLRVKRTGSNVRGQARPHTNRSTDKPRVPSAGALRPPWWTLPLDDYRRWGARCTSGRSRNPRGRARTGTRTGQTDSERRPRDQRSVRAVA